MAMRARSALSFFSGWRIRRAVAASILYPTDWPPTRILPPSNGSRKLMQFNNVLLPDPDGPITTTTSPDATSRSIPRSTVWLPKLFTRLLISSSAVMRDQRHSPECVGRTRLCYAVASLEKIIERQQWQCERKVTKCHARKRTESIRLRAHYFESGTQQISKRDGGYQRGILQQRDRFVRDRRKDAAKRLWQDDPAHCQSVRHPERAGRPHLPGIQ